MTFRRVGAGCLAWIGVPALLLFTACGDPGSKEPVAATGTAESERLRAVTEEGPIKATVELEPREPLLGDALTLTLTVEAEPDVTVEMPAFGEALGRFSILDFTPRKRTEPDGRSMASQRYTLQAPMSGTQRIPPLRIEFLDEREGRTTPDEPGDYREMLTDSLTVNVASVLPEGAISDELRPVRPVLRELRKPLNTLTVLGALAIVGGMIALSWFLRGLSRRRARVTAYDKAMRRIAALESSGFPAPGAADAWYVELSDIVRHYLEDRYGVRAPELTTEEFLQEARGSAELTRAHRELLSSFLEQCDQVKFAAYHPEEPESKQALATSRRFLDETRLVAESSDEIRRTAA